MLEKLRSGFAKTTMYALVLCLVLQSTVLAQVSPEYAQRVAEVSSHTYTMAEGLDFTESVLSDSKTGFQRTYKFEYTPGLSSNMIFATGSSLYSRNLLSTMITGVDPSRGNVVGGMNADFFNMSTGVPESAVIRDGVLLTSDRDNNCLAITSDGKMFFDMPSVKLSMTRGETEYHIVLLNKELTDYGIYMYTDSFSDTTKITAPSSELVLYPYSQEYTYEDMAKKLYGEELPEDFYTVTLIEPEKTILPAEPEDETAEDADAAKPSDGEETEPKAETDAKDTAVELDEKTDSFLPLTETGSESDNGSGDAADGKETAENTIEPPAEIITVNEKYVSLLDEEAKKEELTKLGEKYFMLGKAEPRIGKTQNVVVAELRKDGNDVSKEIPKGSYVLAAQDSTYGYTLENFAVGETVAVSVKANEKFNDVTEAIGCGCMIVENGMAVTNTALSHYKYANPRTAVGITADGKIVLFAVDGRQSNFSTGLTLSELSEEMIKAGCTYAANLDGGGSTTVKALMPYLESCGTVNSTSDSSERKVSNAILFSNTAPKTGIMQHSFFFNGAQFVLPHSGAALGETYYTDENHYPVTVDYARAPFFKHYAANGQGSVKDGYYYPDGYVGKAVIYSESPDGYVNEATNVISTDKVDSIYVIPSVTSIYEGDTIDLAVGAVRYSMDVACTNDEFTWSVDPQYGYILDSGLFVSTAAGDDIVISASFGDTTGTCKVNVKPLPFVDITDHWAHDDIFTLYQKGIVVGEETELGRMYYPERTYTRNEFCLMLARVMDIRFEEEVKPEERIPMEFSDVDLIPGWSYGGVLALYNKGLLYDFVHYDENGAALFDGNTPVTRREVISVIGRICEASPEGYEVQAQDVNKSDSDYMYIANAVNAGIFEGYEDGTLRVTRSLSRAEGAAVFVRLAAYLKK